MITQPVALAVFFLYLVILLIVAVSSERIMRRTKIDKYVEEFYTAGRGLGTVVIAFMIAAGLCSAGTFLGGSGLLWKLGLGFTLMGISQCFMNFYVLGEFGKKVGIIARRIKAESFLDLFMYRYEKNKVLILGGALAIIIFLGAYTSAQFVGGARVLEVMTGFPYAYGLLLYGGIVIIYVTVGGLRGASMAILVQGTIMTVASIILIIGSISYVGGIKQAFITIAQREPTWAMPFGTLSIKYIFSLWLAFGFGIAAIPHGLMGTMVYKNTKVARKAMLLGGVVVVLWTVGLVLPGVVGKAVNPDLIIPDHNLPTIAFQSLPGWLSGVLLAGIAGAIQSTIAVLLLVISSTIVKNVYQNYINPKASAVLMKKVTMTTTLILSTIFFLLAFKAPPMLEWIIIFSVTGCTAAFLIPLLGFYWPRGNQYGAVAALFGGFGTNMLAKTILPKIAMGMDAVFISLIVAAVLFVGVSLVTKEPSKETLQLFWGKYKPETK